MVDRFVPGADPLGYFAKLQKKHDQDDENRIGLGRFVPCPGSWFDKIVPHALELCETKDQPGAPKYKKGGGRKTAYKRRYTVCRRCGLSEQFWGDGYITPIPVMAFDIDQIKDILLEIKQAKALLKERWIRRFK